MSKMA